MRLTGKCLCGAVSFAGEGEGDFDQSGKLTLAREIFVDGGMDCVRLAGDHPRMTEAEYLRSIGPAPA